MPPIRSSSGLTLLEALVALSLTGLLVAATLPRLVQIRRTPGENALYRTHDDFADAVGAIHGRWLLEGGTARELPVGDQPIWLNENGWPTLDPAHPEQDTAHELYARVVGTVLSEKRWRLTQSPAPEAGTATFERLGPGGGRFSYDAATGLITRPGSD